MISSATFPGSQSTDLFLVCNAAEEKIQVVAGVSQEIGLPPSEPQQARAGRRTTPFFASERAAMGQGLCYVASDIAHALEGAGCPVAEAAGRLKGIACVRGPGSFTGLRLVLSSVLGLHKAWGTPLAGIEYLPLLAQGAGASAGEAVWVLTHARNRQVYAQGFRTAGGTLQCEPLAPPDALDIDTVAELVGSSHASCRILGSGLRKNRAFFNAAFSDSSRFTLLPEAFDTPSPTLLLQAARQAQFAASPVTPLYLRASDAENNLPEIAKKHGFDPEAAVRLLTIRTSE